MKNFGQQPSGLLDIFKPTSPMIPQRKTFLPALRGRVPGSVPCSPAPFPMKPEKQSLIHDLLDEQRDRRREATLLAGGRILRRRHWRRARYQVVDLEGTGNIHFKLY